MSHVAAFFAGAFLCNCIPHLAAGLQGVPFPTPFARPRGVADSPPLVNFLWGTFNACTAVAILSHDPVTPGANLDSVTMLAGVLLLGIYLSRHFGRVRAQRRPEI